MKRRSVAKRSIAASLGILISVTIVYPQKRSDRQDYELIGRVKVVRAVTLSYKFEDGKYSEKESPMSEPMALVFDVDGNLLFRALGMMGLLVGDRYPDYPDRGSRFYDRNGNITEYLSADTVEHSSYKTKYVYDSNGRIVRSQDYDPYKLTGETSFTYNSFDEHGNWTARTRTPETPVNGRSWKTLEFRTIEYYR